MLIDLVFLRLILQSISQIMKKAVLISILFLTAGLVSAQVTKGQYGVKSGHVEYKLTGNTTGTKTLWWDNYGEQSYVEEISVTVIEMMGVKTETRRHTIMVINGDEYWMADLIKNTGQEGTISALMGTEGIEDMSVAAKQEMGEQMLDSLGAERRGTETILGYECEVIFWGGSTSWNYEGVILKQTVDLMGVAAYEDAISFDKNVAFPQNLLVKKTGINYSNNDEMMKLFQQYNMEENESDDE